MQARLADNLNPGLVAVGEVLELRRMVEEEEEVEVDLQKMA
jgi:hypothetical protein